jgi:hypothetical protein
LRPKDLEKTIQLWEIPRMVTAKADNRQRIRIPDIKPGQVFAVENQGNGVIRLTEVKPVDLKRPPTKVRFVKRGRYTVGQSSEPVDMNAVKELLAEFP